MANKAKFIGSSSAPRPKGDLYPTSTGVTMALMDWAGIMIPQKIWEPACGLGHISKVLSGRYGRDVVSTDLYDWGYGQSGVDFYSQQETPDGRFMLTNPPYLIEDHPDLGRLRIDHWIEHSMGLGGYCGMALLLRTVALAGKARRYLHKEAGLAWVLQFDGRIALKAHNSTKKPQNMIDYAWFIYLPWDNPSYPRIDWISEKNPEQMTLFEGEKQ